MICGACGIKNDDTAERCAHCGALLHLAEPKTQGKLCRGCGFENGRHSKFCIRCGADLRFYGRTSKTNPSHRQKISKKDPKLARIFRWHPAVVTMGLLGGVFVLIMAFQMLQNARTPEQGPAAPEVRSTDPKIESSVMTIASRYLCSCGSCQQEPLDICTCVKAVEVRQFIRNRLQVGQSDSQIMVAVDQTYGWKKNDAES